MSKTDNTNNACNACNRQKGRLSRKIEGKDYWVCSDCNRRLDTVAEYRSMGKRTVLSESGPDVESAIVIGDSFFVLETVDHEMHNPELKDIRFARFNKTDMYRIQNTISLFLANRQTVSVSNEYTLKLEIIDETIGDTNYEFTDRAGKTVGLPSAALEPLAEILKSDTTTCRCTHSCEHRGLICCLCSSRPNRCQVCDDEARLQHEADMFEAEMEARPDFDELYYSEDVTQ